MTDAQNDTTTTDTPPRKTPSGAALPWALVAVLTALCLLLGTLLVLKTDDLNKANAKLASAPATTGTTAKPGAGQVSAQPTTGDRAQQLLTLQKRHNGDPMALGKADAPIVLIEWADYRCPFCAKWSMETLPALKPYIDSGSLRVEFHDLTLFGDQSAAAAAAARAAGNQGKYWEYAHALWAIHTGQGHPDVTDDVITNLANTVGITDMARFNADRTSAETLKAVTQDSMQAQQLGLKATPFFLINTTPISGALPTDQFIDVIEQYGGKK